MKKKCLALFLIPAMILASACQGEIKKPEPPADFLVTETEEETESEPEAVLEPVSEPEPETETEEKKPVEMEVSSAPAVDLGYRIVYGEEELPAADDPTVMIYSVSWEDIEITKPELTALNLAMLDWSEKNRESIRQSELLKEAPGVYEENKETWEGFYSLSNTVHVQRFDDQVFSFENEEYTYTGGAHGDTGLFGYTYDTASGVPLSLDDIVLDRGSFNDYAEKYLSDYLRETYGEEGLFEGWDKELVTYMESGPEWCLNAYGLELMIGYYIVGPYALGNIRVTIPYGELAGLVKDTYLKTSEAFTYQFAYGEEVTVDGSGNKLLALYDGSTITLQFGEEAFVAAEGVEYAANPWVSKMGPDQIYVLLETGTYGEEMQYTHSVFKLSSGAFVKLDEIVEREVTDASEVEVIIEGML